MKKASIFLLDWWQQSYHDFVNLHWRGNSENNLEESKEYIKHCFPLLFWDKSITEFEIPCIINNYKYKVKGVDLSNQPIAYYCPKVRCRCNWMALFFHCLGIICINHYIVTSCGVQLSLQYTTLPHQIHQSQCNLLPRLSKPICKVGWRISTQTEREEEDPDVKHKTNPTKEKFPLPPLWTQTNFRPRENQWLCVMCRFKAAKDRIANKKKKRKRMDKNEDNASSCFAMCSCVESSLMVITKGHEIS